MAMKRNSKENFHVQQARGKYGEHMAQLWGQGIDYHNLKPVTHMTLLDGSGRIDKASRPMTEQVWIEGKKYYNQENDANRDWCVWDNNHSSMERHEAKAQFRAYGTDPRGEEPTTENIVIEVDAASVMNIDQCKNCTNKRNPMKKYGWHHPNPKYRAEWYHHYLPLHDRGAQSEVTNDNFISRLNEEEWNNFKQDESIGDYEAIVSVAPFEYMLIMSGEYQQELLERYCGIKFGGMKEPVKERYHFLLPAAEVTREVLNGDAHGQATIVPMVAYYSRDFIAGRIKVTDIERVWIARRMFDEMTSVSKVNKLSAENADILFNWLTANKVDPAKILQVMQIVSNGGAYMVRQTVDTNNSLYQMKGGYNEPLCTLDIMMRLPIFE